MDLKERQNLIEQMSIWINTQTLSKHAIAVSCADVAERYHKEQLRLNRVSIELPTKYDDLSEELKNLLTRKLTPAELLNGEEIMYKGQDVVDIIRAILAGN